MRWGVGAACALIYAAALIARDNPSSKQQAAVRLRCVCVCAIHSATVYSLMWVLYAGVSSPPTAGGEEVLHVACCLYTCARERNFQSLSK